MRLKRCDHGAFKGIGFDIQLDVTEVLSDAKWLAFIMRQLLTNSIKYSENSDITIYSHERAGQTVLEVKDSGRALTQRIYPAYLIKDLHRRQTIVTMRQPAWGYI